MSVPLVVGLAAASAAVATYASVLRPRFNRWGATDEEIHKTLPGDDLENSMGDRLVSTRAITGRSGGSR